MLLTLNQEVYQMLHDHKNDDECYKAFAARLLTRELYRMEFEMDSYTERDITTGSGDTSGSGE